MTELTDKVLDRIRTEGMKPTPRWRFVLRRTACVSGLAVAVAAGSLAVSATIHLFVDYEWDVVPGSTGDAWLFLAQGVPYFWIVVIAVFVTAAVMDFRRTGGGYRYRSSAVVLGCLGASLVSGCALYVGGYGEAVDGAMDENWSAYRTMTRHRRDVWNNPEGGMLGGVAEVTTVDDVIKLRDFEGREWEVRMPQGSEMPTPPAFPPGESAPVRIIGRPIGDGQFEAQEVRTWRGHWRPGKALHETCPELNDDADDAEDGEDVKFVRRCRKALERAEKIEAAIDPDEFRIRANRK